ncbi:hypothetical protein RJ55_08324 [Drechmeria coniospora]|nr:hypothetical protein RJ55_08324 [Drechmeria coniospora]
MTCSSKCCDYANFGSGFVITWNPEPLNQPQELVVESYCVVGHVLNAVLHFILPGFKVILEKSSLPSVFVSNSGGRLSTNV